MMKARPALVLERSMVCLLFGSCSHSFTVFHLRLCQDNVGANGWLWICYRFGWPVFFSSFRTGLLAYMNRLDAVLGVDRIVLKENSFAKFEPSNSC